MYNNFDPQAYAEARICAYYEDRRELDKTIAKATAVENIRLQGFIARQQLRQKEEERKKSTFDDLILTPEGELQFITRNLSINAEPRSLTNMEKPSITILRRANDITQIIFLINCFANGIPREIFLNPQKTEKFSYIKRKFSFANIYLRIPKEKKDDFFSDLVNLLFVLGSDERFIPDDTGYFESENCGLVYVGEDDLTWKKAVNLCK